MARTTLQVEATPERVFEILSDPRAYTHWVVGSKEVRRWDPAFPAAGTSFHHTFAVGPIRVRDHTTVLEVEAPRHLLLRARARPSGIAHVALDLSARDGGAQVVLTEWPVEGLAAKLHNPVQDGLIKLRNAESLRRLRRLAEQR